MKTVNIDLTGCVIEFLTLIWFLSICLGLGLAILALIGLLIYSFWYIAQIGGL